MVNFILEHSQQILVAVIAGIILGIIKKFPFIFKCIFEKIKKFVCGIFRWFKIRKDKKNEDFKDWLKKISKSENTIEIFSHWNEIKLELEHKGKSAFEDIELAYCLLHGIEACYHYQEEKKVSSFIPFGSNTSPLGAA